MLRLGAGRRKKDGVERESDEKGSLPTRVERRPKGKDVVIIST